MSEAARSPRYTIHDGFRMPMGFPFEGFDSGQRYQAAAGAEPFAAESPVTLAEIELDDGGTMLTRIVDVARDAQLSSGAAVKLVPMPQAARYTLPTFTIV